MERQEGRPWPPWRVRPGGTIAAPAEAAVAAQDVVSPGGPWVSSRGGWAFAVWMVMASYLAVDALLSMVRATVSFPEVTGVIPGLMLPFLVSLLLSAMHGGLAFIGALHLHRGQAGARRLVLAALAVQAVVHLALPIWFRAVVQRHFREEFGFTSGDGVSFAAVVPAAMQLALFIPLVLTYANVPQAAPDGGGSAWPASRDHPSARRTAAIVVGACAAFVGLFLWAVLLNGGVSPGQALAAGVLPSLMVGAAYGIGARRAWGWALTGGLGTTFLFSILKTLGSGQVPEDALSVLYWLLTFLAGIAFLAVAFMPSVRGDCAVPSALLGEPSTQAVGDPAADTA